MDEKKVREAINLLEICVAGYNDVIRRNPDDELLLLKAIEKKNHLETAIEALEMQLPKEIMVMDEERSEEFGDVDFRCPNCKSNYACDIADMPNYCAECGIRFNT